MIASADGPRRAIVTGETGHCRDGEDFKAALSGCSVSRYSGVGRASFGEAAMEAVKGFVGALFGSAIGIVFMLCTTLGWAYWMWMAIKLGSFMMFFFGLLGPLAIVAGILGLWSFLFGIPLWLLHMVR
jgi:hypothetical protein